MASPRTACGRRRARQKNNDTTHQSGVYGFQLSWEIDLFGRLRREQEAAMALALASEQGRRGVLVTLVGDVATNYFLLRELDLQLEIARRNASPERRDRRVLPESSRRGRVESSRTRSDSGPPRADGGGDPGNRAADCHCRKRDLAAAGPCRPDPSRASGLTTRKQLPPQIPPGLPATLLERRPDVVEAEQVLVAANADIGVAKSLFYPTISLTGFLGGVSGDLTSFLGGSGAVWSLSPGLFQPIFQAGRLRRNLEAAQARFDAALAEYQKAALNSYREVANALVTIQKLAEQRGRRQEGVLALQDASDWLGRDTTPDWPATSKS